MTYVTRLLTGTVAALALAVPAAATEYRVAVGDGAGGTQEALGLAFIAALEEQSGGEMTGKLFLNGQLGDEQDTVTAAATGTLDFSILAINNITPFSPSVGTLTLPYVILSQDDAEAITQVGKLIERLPVPEAFQGGTYFPPCAVEIDSLAKLKQENFGAMLHVIRYPGRQLEAMVDALNATGFGLTLGVHSRIEGTWRRVQAQAEVGNCYINRNMVGAVVGVQPFGGEGLSGTGPKAGGPHYLLRFVTERTLTINTAAVGGNARLLSQSG